eukprot:s3395_g1.t1
MGFDGGSQSAQALRLKTASATVSPSFSHFIMMSLSANQFMRPRTGNDATGLGRIIIIPSDIVPSFMVHPAETNFQGVIAADPAAASEES